MTTVATSIPTTALNSSTSLFRQRLRVMSDGFRVALYTDGTNLVYRTSASGATWSSATTAIAGITSIPATLSAVVVGQALYILRLSGAGIAVTKLPYSGNGVFTSAVNTTPIATVSPSPGSIRAVYDASGTTADSQHTAGKTGIIHLLCDCGGSWLLYALDPNTAATSPKMVTSTTITTGISNPTYASDMILRISGPTAKLYVLGSNVAGAWTAKEITYIGSAGQSTYAVSGTEFWVTTNTSGIVFQLLAPNTYYDDGGLAVYASNYTPPTDTASGAGTTGKPSFNVGAIGGTVFPSGTWTFQTALSIQNVKAVAAGAFTLKVGANIYALVGSTYTLIGSLPPGSAYTITAGTTVTSATTTLSCTVSLPAYTAPSGAQLVVVPYYLTGGYGLNQASGSAFIAHTQHKVTTPVPTGSQGFTAGVTEAPSLPAAMSGASLCLSDTTASPGVDIAVIDGSGNVKTVNRTKTASYSPAQTIGAGATVGLSPIIAANSATGNEACFWLASSHIQSASRTTGAWAVSNQEDTSGTAVQQEFSAVQTGSLGTTGPAILYVNGSSPYNLQYEDGGTGSGAVAPMAPTVTMVDTPGVNDAFGSASPFVTIGTAPVTRVTYNEATAGDKLGAIRLVWTDTTASSTAWDSGRVAVTNGPLPGGTIDVAYGSIGAAATTIVPGHAYSVQAYAYESIGGQVSPASTAVVVNAQSAPTATSVTPSTITSVTQTVTFVYGQAESVALGGYQLTFTADDGVVDYDTGFVAATLAAGGTESITTLNLAHKIRNNIGYTLTFTLTTAPVSGPVWIGTSTASAVTTIPTSPQPSAVVARWNNGTTPLNGGGVDLTWQQTSGSPAAVANIIYLRDVTKSAFVQVASVVPPAVGNTGTFSIYSVANGKTYDVGITSISADGMESVMVIDENNTARFAGFRLHQVTDPSICVNLTLTKSGDTYHQWDDQTDEDWAELFDRKAPVHTIGTLYYLLSDGDVKFTLPAGYDRAMMDQLMAWRAAGETLLIREWQGHMVIGMLVRAAPTAEDAAHIYRAVVNFKETDATGIPALIGG